MFGLSLTDAIALSSFFATIAAALIGLSRGGQHQKELDTELRARIPAAAAATMLIDMETFRDLVGAVRDVADAIRDSTDRREQSLQAKIAERLETLAEQLDQHLK